MKNHATLADLDKRREEILEGIAVRGDVWEVEADGGTFVLGPYSVCGQVIGLYDEEYGWPEPVDADGPIENYIPGGRRHPFIQRRGQVVAVAVSPAEYADLLARPGPGA